MAAAARLQRLEEFSTRADANIKGCQAAIDDLRASVNAIGLQLSGYIHNKSSSLDNLGQRAGAVSRQEAILTKPCERITQEMADIGRVTAPLKQVTTLQRVVSGLEPKVRSLEGQYQNFKIRQAAVIEQVHRTAGLLDERTIAIRAKTSRLTYSEQTLQTALNGITIVKGATEESSGLGTPSPPADLDSDPPPSHCCSGSDRCCPCCASKVSSLENANKILEHEVAQLNTQVVHLRG